MSAPSPDRETMRAALALAVLAPSIHNSQPWRWRLGLRSLHLYADRTRWLPNTDPGERDLLLSCGAALHHARTGLATLGWAGQVNRLPNADYPDHLAAIELHRHEPTRRELAMATAIPHRHADRRRYSGWPVPQARYAELTELTATEGVVLYVVHDDSTRAALATAIGEADQAQRANPQAAAELAQWSGRSRLASDGVLAASAGEAAGYGDLALRGFVGTPDVAPPPDGAGELLVLGTASDDRVSRLKAGEAASAVMLAATADGLTTCPLSQPLEVGRTRQVVTEVLGGDLTPQLIIRIGWPAMSADTLPRTPRRAVDDVIDKEPTS